MEHPGRYLYGFMREEGVDVTDLAEASNVVTEKEWQAFIDGEKDLNPLIVSELCVLFDFDTRLWTELDRKWRDSDD